MCQLLGDFVLETPYPYLTSPLAVTQFPLLQNPGGATAWLHPGRKIQY